MEHPIEQFDHQQMTVKIYYDESPESPREWDNLGKLVIFSNGKFTSVNELDTTYYTGDYDCWEDLHKAVFKDYPGAEMLPVYRYEHGGVAYSTCDFCDPWDSGMVGFILVTKEDMLKEYGKKIVTQKVRERARKLMKSEIEGYSQWANGDVYGYVIEDKDGEVRDSVWGFYGLDYVIEAAKIAAENESDKIEDNPTDTDRLQILEDTLQILHTVYLTSAINLFPDDILTQWTQSDVANLVYAICHYNHFHTDQKDRIELERIDG